MLQRPASGSVLDMLIFEAANFAEGKLPGRVPCQLGTALQFVVATTDSDVQLYMLRVCTLTDFTPPLQPPGFLSTRNSHFSKITALRAARWTSLSNPNFHSSSPCYLGNPCCINKACWDLVSIGFLVRSTTMFMQVTGNQTAVNCCLSNCVF